ncbi:MAG: rhodanese-related sulfurtransferase, partial [Betaproteobacteria bacterium]|nr:rhodanese-related sulfurtransferase [Betaproteobacteria bacterium]
MAFCEAHNVKGLILLAREGINSTIAGAPEDVHAVLAYLRSDPLLSDLEHKESFANKPPFHRMKVRLKREIVTLGVPGISPTRRVGQYVKPKDWNALISSPDVVVVDTRNDYEVEIGTFKGALDPNIQSFSQLPGWVQQAKELEARNGKKPKVAMFCTGGIRCEKSTSLMLEHGFEEVFHLQGGILKYLEEVPPEQSLWEGECFVFDERVSVGHGLKPGPHELCRCCREPLPPGAKTSPLFELGVSCPRCHAHTSEVQKNSARERQKQWEIAKARQINHIGTPQRQEKVAALLPQDAPILYSFRRCPYAMRARLALLASGIRCEMREIALSQKPDSMLAVSPKGTVPVLVLKDKVLEESLDIMHWAMAQSDPQCWSTAGQSNDAQAQAWVRSCDDEFKKNLDRYKYPNRYALSDGLAHRDMGAQFLLKLNAQLEKTPYLMGGDWCWVDAAIAPFVRQFART